MKSVIIRNNDNSAYVEFITDLTNQNNEGLFTIMEIRGLDDVEVKGGIDFKTLADDVSKGETYNVGFFKQWATDRNYICEIIPLEGMKTILVETQVALSVDEGEALTPGVEGEEYEHTLQSLGGNLPLKWDVSVGELPEGLTLEADTGKITGTPTTADTYTFTVRVADVYGKTDSLEVDLVVTSEE